MKALRIIKKKIFSKLFAIDSIILFQKKENSSITSEVVVERVNPENVSDILYFQEKKYVETFQKFLQNGDVGYYGYIDGKCIHRSWAVVNENSKYQLHRFVKKRLNKDEVYIHYCETAPIARGKNVYPFVINKIANDFIGKDVFICVNKKNIPSIKGVKKAGFVPVQSIFICCIFGVRFKKKKNLV